MLLGMNRYRKSNLAAANAYNWKRHNLKLVPVQAQKLEFHMLSGGSEDECEKNLTMPKHNQRTEFSDSILFDLFFKHKIDFEILSVTLKNWHSRAKEYNITSTSL